MPMSARLPRSRTVKRTARPASQSEAQASVKALVCRGIGVERDPREPLLEVRARTAYRAPQIGGVVRLDGAQQKTRRLDGVMANLGPRRDYEHGRGAGVEVGVFVRGLLAERPRAEEFGMTGFRI